MTGRTVEEAVEAALEQLGVAEKDAEIVVVEEPRSGMFGLRRGSARIQARVRPAQPRAKRPSHRPRAAAGSPDRGHRRQAGRQEGAPSKPAPKGEGGDHPQKTAGPTGRAARGSARQGQGPVQNGSRTRNGNAGPQAAESGEEEASNASPTGRRRSRSRGRSGRDRLANGAE